MAALTLAGKFGGFLQVDADDVRLMTSQVSMYGISPPQMSSLDKPLNKIIVLQVRIGKDRLGSVRLNNIRLGLVWFG